MSSKKQQALERIDEEDKIRFWRNVVKTNHCWLWTGNININGYAAFSVDGICVIASRFAYQAFIGPIPDGLLVLHHCDNRLCVNFQDCLFLGSYKDNTQDCLRKGRANKNVSHPGVAGPKNGRAKLTQEDLDKIKSLLPFHSNTEISKLINFKVSRCWINVLRKRKINQ